MNGRLGKTILGGGRGARGARPGGSIAVGDLNGDGRSDVAATEGLGGNNLPVYLSNGDGTFTAGSPVGVGADPQDLAMGRFNADNALDIAVANGSTGSVSILLTNGSGVFAAGTPVASPGGSGNDRINAANRRTERIDCGRGRRGRVRADRKDRVKGCEVVRRTRR